MPPPDNRPRQVSSGQISDETASKLINLEKQRLELFILKQQTRDKEIDASTTLAKLTIESEREYARNQPKQDRYTLALAAGIVFVFLVLFCLFVAYMLHTGNKDLAKLIIIGLTHMVAGAAGFYGGKKVGKASATEAQEIPEAQVIDTP
jgi:lipopolysaccharide export LptBFGC system permease protein LptF